MRRALLIVLTLALLGLAACSGNGSQPNAGSGANALVYLEHQPHTDLYPPNAGLYPNGGLVNNITDRLTYQNPETLDIEPWIATQWEVNDDATEFTFTLRDGVTFSDGTPLDAAAVAKNFDLFGKGDPDRGLIVSEAINNYERSEVLDPLTVRFHFTASSPGFLQATSTITSGLLSSSTLDRTFEQFGAGQSQEIIGSGPFVITDEQLGTELTLSAREDYDWAPPSLAHQGRAKIDAVQVVVTPEDSVRVGALISQQADAIRYVEAQDEPQVSTAGLTILAPQTKGVNNGLSLRFRHPLLADISVRQALLAATDRAELVATIYSPNYPLATSALSSAAQGYADQSENYAFDPQRASELLDAAGWRLGADGIREQDGQRLTLVVNEAAPQPRSFEALTLVSQQWRKVGIDLQILRADAGTYAEAILDAEQVQLYHSMVGRTDLDVIKSQFYSANRNTLLNLDRSDSSIGDPELERLLEAVSSEPDPQARIAADERVQEYLSEQAYVIPFFEEPQVYGVQPWVRDLGFESVARPSFYAVWLDR